MTRPLTIVAAALLVVAAAALAQAPTRQHSSFTLSETRPAKGTDEHFAFDYVNPDDPAAKPPAVRRVTTILPRGGRYDPAVPEDCTASDAELTAQGAAACPPRSAVGGGVITVDTGVEGPGRIVTADVEFFNNATDPEGEFIYLNTIRGSEARVIVRADVRRRQTVTTADMLPGTPPDGGAIDTVDVTVENVSAFVDGERRHYVTTPRRCRGRKRDRHWTARVRFEYDGGVAETVATPTRCVDRRKR